MGQELLGGNSFRMNSAFALVVVTKNRSSYIDCFENFRTLLVSVFILPLEPASGNHYFSMD